jgi:anti-sigma-K factor RskA
VGVLNLRRLLDMFEGRGISHFKCVRFFRAQPGKTAHKTIDKYHIKAKASMPAEQSNLCDDLQPWLAAYALGDAEAGAAERAHLAICPRCQHDLREYQLVAGLLPYSAPEAAPRPELREQLLAAVVQQAGEAAPAPRPASYAAPTARPFKLRRQPSFWAALAFAAMALALLGWNISLRRELERQTALVSLSRQNWQTMVVLLDDKDLSKYSVVADPPPPPGEYAAHGHFWASPRAQTACLVVQGLPDLRADQVYQVWLVRGGEQTSGGTFEAHNGKAWAFVDSAQPITAYSQLFVTIEPAGGSAQPAGSRVVSGAIAGGTTAGSTDRQLLLALLSDQPQRKD